MVLDDEDEAGVVQVSGCVVFLQEFLQPECLHGASIHHCAWCNAFSM